MAISKRRKRRLKTIRKERKAFGVFICQTCGGSLKNSGHHAYFHTCWTERKNKGLSTAPLKEGKKDWSKRIPRQTTLEFLEEVYITS